MLSKHFLGSAVARVKDVQGAFLIKRWLDVLISCALLIVSLPVLVVISITIKTSSQGPLFYADERFGLGGVKFRCIKFRTMVPNAEQFLKEILESDPTRRAEYELKHKLEDDPRITKVGRFLRKTSLDEIPQLWNILRGDMSLVGPRPYLVRESQEMGSSKEVITQVRPGLTGLWQVSGRSNCSFRERLTIETEYVQTWSLALDFKILLRTLKVILARDGAY